MRYNLPQKLITVGLDGERRAAKIISIKKTKGYFTGKSIWCIMTDSELFPMCNFHAKLGHLNTQKAEIIVD